MNTQSRTAMWNSNTHTQWLIILIASLTHALSTSNVSAQSERATFAQGFTEDGRSPLLEYSSLRRLRIEVASADQGLKVLKIYDNSPVERLRSLTNPKILASMEVNDVIRSINRVPLQTGDDLVRELQTVGEECEIEVLDVRTNKSITWLVKPAYTFTPKTAGAAYANAPTTIHVIIAAATNDQSLGKSIELSIEDIKSNFQRNVDPSRLNLQVIQGSECSAFGIASAIDKLKVGFEDGILIYYLGHGAYDDSLVEKDPFRGQFFDFPGTDLLRRTVWNHLESKPVRLRMLVSDACNNRSHAKLKTQPTLARAYESKVVTGSTNLEWLLLGYSGDLDINAASRDEFAWYSNDRGGWFTESFLQVISKNSDWTQVADILPGEANRIFQQNKKFFLGFPATTATVPTELLSRQRKLTPLISVDLTRDESPPFPQGIERQLNIKIETP